jgi:hypothetical protein
MSADQERQERARRIQPENFPEELRRRNQWVNHDADKQPWIAGTKQRASSTDSETWRSFDEAYRDGRGPGFVFTSGDPYTGVDLDHCRDPETGTAQEWAQEIIDQLDGYTEVSFSGTGFHILVRGKLPVGGTKRGNIEAFRQEKYFTMPGTGSGGKIPERQAELERFYREHLEVAESRNGHDTKEARQNFGQPTDEQIIEKLLGEKSGKGRALFGGDLSYHDGDDSAADHAFVYKLYYYTQDLPQIERIHRMSGLDREKTRRVDYLRRSFFKAANATTDTYEWDRTKMHAGSSEATSGPEQEEPQEHPFPIMDEAAYRGIFGEIVETIEPHTEADPVAILLSALAAFGSAYGRRGYVEISGTRHHGNLFVGIVGDTARARKGTSWSPVKNIFGTAEPEWTQNRIVGGLSSGEGLINVVRDEVEGEDKDGDTIVVDKGVLDKRLLVAESELSQGLKVLRREGNTLSPILRNAWDGGDLATLTRNSPLRATEPHISILGHITSTELLKHLVESEAANGFGNRFLWACVKRSKKLPFGGELSSVDMSPIIRGLRSTLDHRAGRMSFAQSARDTWVEMYASLTEDRPGMFGMITARAEAQTLRLAILYALAAGSNEIGVEHLASAYAVWGYCEDSALYLFGDQLGDADADKLLDALRGSPEGMSRTQIRDLFQRNKKPEELQRILDLLESFGKAYVKKEKAAGMGAGGRPPEVWYAA